MAGNELIDYIKSTRAQGFNDDSIKAHLIKYGYGLQLIEEAFKESGKAPVQKSGPPPEKRKLSKLAYAYIALAVLFVLMVSAGSYVILKMVPEKKEACIGVEIRAYSLDDQPVFCIFPDNSKIMIIMENSGQKPIDGVIIKAEGEKGINATRVDNLNLKPKDVSPKVLDYDYAHLGSLKKLTLIPVTKEYMETSCSGFTAAEFRIC